MKSNGTKERVSEVREGLKMRWDKLTDRDIDKIEGALEDMVGTFEKRYRYGRNRAEDEVERFAREYVATKNQVKEGATNALQGMQRTTEKAVRQAEHTVARYPWQTILVMLAVGLSLGVLLGLIPGKANKTETERQ
jgi:ElaB/YqjD/DUF883 family membrane-anchored ribosome-binding protein